MDKQFARILMLSVLLPAGASLAEAIDYDHIPIPVFQPDLVARLIVALQRDNAEIAVAHDGQRMQPVYALIPKRLLPSLEQYLAKGDRKIDLWYAQHAVALADFSDATQTFANINTPDDRHRLEQEVLNV